MRRGFTLLELLVVVGILGVLLSLLWLYAMPVRKRAALLAGMSYVRSVATSLEALRDAQGNIAFPPDCMQGFGERPSFVTQCTITPQGGAEYRIEAHLEGAALSRVVYESQSGALSTLP